MHQSHALRRLVLLAAITLSACAASNPISPSLAQSPSPRVRIGGPVAAQLVARHALSAGDIDVATEAYQSLLARDTDNMELRQQAFLTALVAGRPEAVRLARLLPNNQGALLLLAGNDAREGNWRGAEARLNTLPRQGLMDLLRPMLVAWLQAGAGQTEAALAILRPLTEAPRLRAIYAINAATIADLGGNNAEAGRYYRMANAENGGGNLQVARLYASWLARQGESGEAERVMLGISVNDDVAMVMPAIMRNIAERQITKATDGMAEVYTALAALLRTQDSGEFPVVMLRLALHLRPDHTTARLLLAEIAAAGKHPETALPVIASVAADDPLSAVVRMRRVAILHKLRRSDEALGVLDQLARELPDRPEPLAARGDILRNLHRYGEAVAAYDKAVALVPSPTRAEWVLFYDRGIALDRDKQWAKAEADLLRALDLAPDQPFVLNYLGYSWAEQGTNLPRARAMIERAANLRPDDGAITDSLGWVMFKLGDVPAAVRLMERAVELEPQDATITAHLGDVYWAAGRQLEAVFQWRRALALNPDAEETRKLEARIREGEIVLGGNKAAALP